MKKNKKSVYFIAFLLTVILLVIIKDRIENQVYYNLKSQIKKEFNYVKSMSISNYGPHCTIDVYIKNNNYEFDKIEPIFIKMMLEISDSSNFTYFVHRHCGGRDVELPFFHISFRKQNDHENILYKFSSDEMIQKWELEDKNKCYNISDYLNK